MSEPQILDFSEPEEDSITIHFPDGKTAELPTFEELNMETYRFVTNNGPEWHELLRKGDSHTAAEKRRWEHLNARLCYAICSDVPQKTVDMLSSKRKAKVILSFMTASPALLKLIADELGEAVEALQEPSKPAKRKGAGKRRTTR